METKELEVSDEFFGKMQEALQEAEKQGRTTAVLRQKGSGNCSLEVVVGPGPTIIRYGCTGGCGVWDRFLGRSCQKGTAGTSDGGVALACTCRGGWWDSIFTRRAP